MPSKQSEYNQILETCQRINQILEIQEHDFKFETLTHTNWYLTVLSCIYPQLEGNFQQLASFQDEAEAIDHLLRMLAEEEIIEEDFLQIKGQDIIEGDIQSVYYIVRLLQALIERQSQQQDDAEQYDQQQQKKVQNNEQKQQINFQQQKYSHAPTPSKDLNPNGNQKKDYQNQSRHKFYEDAFNTYDEQDESQQEQRHSVLGIENQFQDYEQEQEKYDEGDQYVKQYPVNPTKSVQYLEGIQKTEFQSIKQQNLQQFSLEQKRNIHKILNPSQQFNNYNTSTKGAYKEYRMKNAKQFSSSQSEDEVPHHSYLQDQERRIEKVQQRKQKSRKQSQEEDQNEYFINPTIKKYKSDAKIKTVASASKKSTQKKYINEQYQSPKITQVKSPKKLITHPTIKKQYRKAANPEAKIFTKQLKNHIATTFKKNKNKKTISPVHNRQKHVVQNLERKKRQLKLKLSDYRQQKQLQRHTFVKSQATQAKNTKQLKKILNWRQGQLKKQKLQFEKSMQMKLQVQKQNYVKKINKLLIKLQKQKQLQEQNLYKQKLLEQNQQAGKRLTAIEQWYKDRIKMLKEKNSSNRNERALMHTGHKEVLKQIQKQLKMENQKQIMAMTIKYRRQQAQIQNDLEELQKQIIKVYKRN